MSSDQFRVKGCGFLFVSVSQSLYLTVAPSLSHLVPGSVLLLFPSSVFGLIEVRCGMLLISGLHPLL